MICVNNLCPRSHKEGDFIVVSGTKHMQSDWRNIQVSAIRYTR